MKNDTEKAFHKRIKTWYLANKRSLPWRNTLDPYYIWLSEIILQQTRVNQGLPYYLNFINAYPDVFSLANAPEKDILRLWQGLGYYSRARNLHQAAKMVVSEYKGVFPDNFNELLKLKGVGRYTAAAIASFSYNEAVPVLDGNVFRVLSRIFGIKKDIADTKNHTVFWDQALKLISSKEPGIFNQAMMEFGALQCTPQSPDCNSCPFKDICYAYATNSQSKLPVKNKKIKKRIRHFHYLIFQDKGNKIWMRERKQKDIWKGLYEFYLIEKEEHKDLADVLKEHFKKNASAISINKIYKTQKHVLTHQTIFASFYKASCSNQKMWKEIQENASLKLYNNKQINDLPKSILLSDFLNEQIFN